MLKWHKYLLTGPGVRNRSKIRHKLDHGRIVPGIFLTCILGKSIQSSGNTAGTDALFRKVQLSCVRRSSELPRAKMKPWIWSQRSFRSSTARQVVSTSKNIGKTGEFMLHILWLIIKFILILLAIVLGLILLILLLVLSLSCPLQSQYQERTCFSKEI